MTSEFLKEGEHQIYSNKSVHYKCSVISGGDGEISIYDQGTNIFPCVATVLKKTLKFNLDLDNCSVSPASSKISGFTITPKLSKCHHDKESISCDITVAIKGFLVNCPSAANVSVSAKRYNLEEEEQLIASAMMKVEEAKEA